MRKILYAAAAAALAIGAALYLSGGRDEPAEPLKTARAARGDLRIEASASGTVNPEVEVIVKSKAGGQIIEFARNEGDSVRKGEALVRLDPQTEEARAKQAEAAMLVAEARLEKARIVRKDASMRLDRQKKLFEDGIVSRQELDDSDIGFLKAGSDVRIAEAELMQAREALKEANERLADTVIRAPFDGTILKKFVDRGQVISSTLSSASEGTQVFSMANLDSVFVVAHMDEVDIAGIRPGQEAVVRADSLPEGSFAAVVERVAPKGRTESTITVFDVIVRVTDGRKAQLRPGMTADVSVTVEQRTGVLLVPREAVKTRGRAAGVYVMKGGKPEFAEVVLGDSDDVVTEVREGLEEGAEVVTSAYSPPRPKEKKRLLF